MKRILFILLIILSSSRQAKVNGEKIESSENNELFYPPYPTGEDCIKYYVQNRDYKELIKSALGSFDLFSCLCFNEEASSIKGEIGINFFEHTDETNVTLSKNKSMPTDVYFKEKTVQYSLKKAAFGVGLALGLIPEVWRSDRDDNINIYLENINDNYKIYYNETRITNSSTDFDFTSTMLYDFNFGATKDVAFRSKLYPHYENMLNNTIVTISYNDKRRVNEIYCSDKCKGRPLCKNGGYYSEYCTFCICPPEFKGLTCEELTDKTCDHKGAKIYNSTGDVESMTLSGIKKKCIFLIQSNNNNSKIVANISEINFYGTSIQSSERYIEIKYRDDKGTKGLAIYQNVSNITLPSLSDKVYVIINDQSGNFHLDIEYHNNETVTSELVHF